MEEGNSPPPTIDGGEKDPPQDSTPKTLLPPSPRNAILRGLLFSLLETPPKKDFCRWGEAEIPHKKRSGRHFVSVRKGDFFAPFHYLSPRADLARGLLCSIEGVKKHPLNAPQKEF